METPTMETTNIPIAMRDLDVVLVDQMVGFTTIEGIARVVLGQLSFVPNSATPAAKAVVALAGTRMAWERIRSQIDDVIKAMDEDRSKIGHPAEGEATVLTDE